MVYVCVCVRGGGIKATTNPTSSLRLLSLAITEQLENCPIRSQRKTISGSSLGLKSTFPASPLDCTNFHMLNGRLLAEEPQLKQKSTFPADCKTLSSCGQQTIVLYRARRW